MDVATEHVCLTDLRVKYGAEYDKPWTTSNTALIGWVDMDKLMAGMTAAPTTAGDASKGVGGGVNTDAGKNPCEEPENFKAENFKA